MFTGDLTRSPRNSLKEPASLRPHSPGPSGGRQPRPPLAGGGAREPGVRPGQGPLIPQSWEVASLLSPKTKPNPAYRTFPGPSSSLQARGGPWCGRREARGKRPAPPSGPGPHHFRAPGLKSRRLCSFRLGVCGRCRLPPEPPSPKLGTEGGPRGSWGAEKCCRMGLSQRPCARGGVLGVSRSWDSPPHQLPSSRAVVTQGCLGAPAPPAPARGGSDLPHSFKPPRQR